MNKITINHGTFQVDERVLDQGTLTLGRVADNDVQIDDDTVSAHHAKIVTVFNASHVEDLGSTNGTFVNGKRIVKHTLHSGDIISAGGYQVVFYSDQGAPKKAPEKTAAMSSVRLEAMIAEADKQRDGKATVDKQQVDEGSVTDTVLVEHEEEDVGAQRDARSTVNIVQRRQNMQSKVVAGTSERFRKMLPAEEQNGSSRYSLYLTLAITVVAIVLLVTVLLRL